MPVPPEAHSPLLPEASTRISVPVRETNPGAELVFDEADALFHKRSEVSDPYDRYSNESTEPRPHKP